MQMWAHVFRLTGSPRNGAPHVRGMCVGHVLRNGEGFRGRYRCIVQELREEWSGIGGMA